MHATLLIMPLCVALGAATPEEPVQTPEERLAELIARLHSPVHAERHSATLALKAMDRAVLIPLQQAYAEHADLEVRARLQEAAEGILFRKALEGMGGFMGIGLQNVRAGGDPQLPPDQRAIKVTRVMQDTGAEAAGLETGDLIIELNGELLKPTGSQADFMNDIRIRPPGEVIFLTIVRDGDYLYKDVVLGLRPANLIDARGATAQRELLDQATRDFAEWCRGARDRTSHAK